MPPKKAPSITEIDNIKQELIKLQNNLDADKYKRKNTTIESLKEKIENLYPQNTPEKIIDHDIIHKYYIVVNTFFEKIYANKNERQNLYSSENGKKKKNTEYLYPNSFFLDIPLIYEKITFPVTSLKANIERDLNETNFDKLLNSVIQYRIEINSYDQNIDMSVLIPDIETLQKNLTTIWKSKIDKINELNEQNANIQKKIGDLSTENASQKELLLQNQQTINDQLTTLKNQILTIFNTIKSIALNMGIIVTDDFTDDYIQLFNKILSLLTKINNSISERKSTEDMLEMNTTIYKEEILTLNTKLKNCNDEKEKMNTEMILLQEQKRDITNQLKEKKNTITYLENQISPETNPEYLTCLQEKKELQEREEKCKSALEEEKRKYKELNDEILELESQLDTEKELNNDQQIQIQQAKDQIHEMEEKVEEKDKEIILLKSKRIPGRQQESEKFLKAKNEELAEKLLLSEQKRENAEINLKNERNDRQMITDKFIKDYDEKRALLKTDIGSLNTDIERLKKEKALLASTNVTINNDQINNLHIQITNLQKEHDQLLLKEKEYEEKYEQEKENLKYQKEKCDKEKEEIQNEEKKKCDEEKKKLEENEKKERAKWDSEKADLQKKLAENNVQQHNHQKTIDALNLEITTLKNTLKDQPEHLIQTHPDANKLTETTEELEKIQKALHDCKEMEEKYKAALKQKDDEIDLLLKQNTPKTETTQPPPLSNKDKLKIYTDDHLQKGTYLSESNGFIHLQIPSDDDLPRRHILFKKTPEETSVYEPLFSDSNGIHYLTIQSENTFKKNYNALSSDVFSVCHLTPQPDFLTQNTIFKQYKKNLVLKDFYPLQNNAESMEQNIFFYDHAFPLVFGAPAEPFRKLWLKGLHRTDFDDIGQTLNAGLRYFFSPSLAYAIECGVLADFAYSSSNPSQYVIHLHFLARPKTLQMLRKDKKDNIQPRKIRKTPLLEVTPVFLRKTSYSEEEERDIEEFSVYMHDWYIRFSEKAHLYPD